MPVQGLHCSGILHSSSSCLHLVKTSAHWRCHCLLRIHRSCDVAAIIASYNWESISDRDLLLINASVRTRNTTWYLNLWKRLGIRSKSLAYWCFWKNLLTCGIGHLTRFILHRSSRTNTISLRIQIFRWVFTEIIVLLVFVDLLRWLLRLWYLLKSWRHSWFIHSISCRLRSLFPGRKRTVSRRILSFIVDLVQRVINILTIKIIKVLSIWYKTTVLLVHTHLGLLTCLQRRIYLNTLLLLLWIMQLLVAIEVGVLLVGGTTLNSSSRQITS